MLAGLAGPATVCKLDFLISFSLSRHSLLSLCVDGCWKCTTVLDRETPSLVWQPWLFTPCWNKAVAAASFSWIWIPSLLDTLLLCAPPTTGPPCALLNA
ncbi:hypothetical protein VIGAN_06066400 [Vigna angularis var. angularis]|uniref:Uncharacterized protein n=1 Tax=Vigna angularis var. angularis TaxID=157739 RepID=A0A0S3SA24_PHAAN|nr:hypothetical protein VIGAN_06066400 [Vigna angularis var. angularis]